ncbi:ABC-type oligopeptide transport system, periplasmic component [Luminiphilus syltensis NOR5-1B]|uniref:ABC-type oligopeptide transport system, periplasmic component n=1 Tax=Luminiphilus syltensis NOR5-1B TaxID=565045 RepID=B8KX63_9GAMM|nr:extracellular solute-binding protein [Luminiphilus syltensis]EED36324.1 ABC-type oligopeptide transport system, periplasmic component [Luminiphilus syltensis NOR5-1B]
MKSVTQLGRWFVPAVAALVLGCGAEDSGEVEEVIDNTAEVEAAYAADPDYYSFKTIDDLPDDLVWERGGDIPEMGSPEANKGGTEYIALTDFPRTLRHMGPDSNGSFRPYLLDDMAVGLVGVHPDTNEYFPGLADEWAIDRDNTTVYFRLDPNARWSDGVPVTSDDFMFLFWLSRSDYIRAPYRTNWVNTQYSNITRYDERTLSITVVVDKPDFETRAFLDPAPRHFYSEVGDDFVERYQWRYVPTTGPYILKEGDLDKGRNIVLTRNKDWWAKDKKHFRYRFNPDRLHFNIIRDTAKRFEAFKRGDIDQMRMQLSEYWYEKLPDSDPDVQAGYIAKSFFYNRHPRPPYGLWMNTAKPLLDDRNIRLGIQHASNWQLVIDQYFRGDAERLDTPQKDYPGFDHPTIEAREYDIEKAQEYFAAAGFDERGPDGILTNAAGEKLALTLSTGYESLSDVMTILKQEAEKAGLELRLEILDGTTGWKKVQEKKHEIHLVAFGRFAAMYPRYWEHYHSENAYDKAFLEDGSINPERQLKPQTNNLESIAIPEVDALIETYRASTDREEMEQISHRLLEILHEHASYVPGYYQPWIRIAHWRWLRYPDFFNHKQISLPTETWVHWIDTDLKEEVQAARKSGQTFPPMLNTYDQWKEQSE